MPDPQRLVVGFDLDMTLVDSRPGIAHSLRLLAAETQRPIDVESVVASLGPPINVALAPWFSAEELPAALVRFRHFMAAGGAAMVVTLPGAAAALYAVRALGGSSLVVTAKHQPLAEATVGAAGLDPDSVVGDLWAEEKAGPLRFAGAVVYVGDHPADVTAARLAGCVAVCVPSGGCSREDLLNAGADVVLTSLEELPDWLATFRPTRSRSASRDL